MTVQRVSSGDAIRVVLLWVGTAWDATMRRVQEVLVRLPKVRKTDRVPPTPTEWCRKALPPLLWSRTCTAEPG